MPILDQLATTKWSGSYTNGTVTYQMGSSTNKMVGFYKSISSLNNSKSFRPGEYRCNPVTIQQFFSTAGNLTFPATKAGSYTYQASGQMAAHLAAGFQPGGMYANPSPWSESKAKEALNRAYAKLASPDLDVGVMLGELPETISGLRNPLSAFRKALKDFKKWRLEKEANDHEMLGLDFKGKGKGLSSKKKKAMNRRRRRAAKRQAMASVDGLTGSLLEYRYGIAPLIGSIQDIIAYVNAAIRQFHEKLQRRRARGQMSSVKTTYTKTGTGVGAYQIDSKFDVETEDQYNASVSYKLKRPPSLDELLGFDFLSIPGIAWELTTLSFVVDWFFSVGKWLDALKSVLSSRFEILGCSVSRKTTIAIRCNIKQVRISGTIVPYVGSGSEYETVSLTMTRKCYPPLGLTDLMPQLNSNVLNLGQQIDLLALAWQRFSKRLR